ncbi:hypothetical protein [Curtobacterium luteum]|uniref:hypothetical protein n=1 Tax=Curtobacterium luteum TaxID=33881 RepID=UPI0037FD8994
MSDDERGSGGRWVLPLRQVLPWWFVGGAVATIAVTVLVVPGGTVSAAVAWGPIIGVVVRDRQLDARGRVDRGLPPVDPSARAPRWVEPVLAVLLTVGVVGLGLLLDALVGHGTIVTTWVGGVLLVAGALGVVVVVTVLRHGRNRGGSRPDGGESGGGSRPDGAESGRR